MKKIASLFMLALLLAACAAQPASDNQAVLPADNMEVPAASEATPTDLLAAPDEPTQESFPTAAAAMPTQPETAATAGPTLAPLFQPAISGGENPNRMYPGQDISVIARNGRIQFLNVYANW